jgi:hypothetical protein
VQISHTSLWLKDRADHFGPNQIRRHLLRNPDGVTAV